MNWKKIGIGLLFPPVWLKLIIAMLFMASVITITTGVDITKTIMCAMVIAYGLVIFITTCIKQIPQKHKEVKTHLYNNEYTRAYVTNIFTKTKIDLIIAITFNVLFIAFNFVSAILYSSNWFGIFAVYYSLISVIRFILLLQIKKKRNKLNELKSARCCACILLAFNLILSGVVFMISTYHEGFKHSGIFLDVLMISLVIATVVDIINVIKYRNHKSPIVFVSQTIKLTSALFSLLCLETAIIARLGIYLPGQVQSALLMLSGLGLSVLVIIMSIYTIVKCNRKIKNN